MRDHSSRPTSLRGRWLLLARLAWVALAAITIGLHVAGVPYAYARTISNLNFDQMTSEQVRVLGDLRLTPEFYAAYTVALSVATMLVFAAIATVIFWRGSEDRMALFGAFMLVVFGGAALTSDVPAALAAAHPTLWLPIHLLDYLGQVAFVVFFYVFPNGRLVPRWTRWLAIACALYWVVAIFFPGSPLNLLDGPIFIGLIGSLVIAQVYRYRRVSGPVERQQTKWVVFGVAVALVGFTMILTLANLVPSFEATVEATGPLGDMVAKTCVYGLILLIPLSIGVAILRSGLYDIDVLINRTLVYGSLTAMLALVYVGGVVGLQSVLRFLTGQESTLAVVASTLGIAALFSPLRSRIQGFIDRRFYRRKYDARKTLAAFNARLREETELETLSGEVVGVVRETMQPEHISLWLRPSQEAANQGMKEQAR